MVNQISNNSQESKLNLTCNSLSCIFRKNKEAKVNNFYLIENSLRKLNVRFDGKLIHQIMEEERGASLRLLYQIKLAC